MITKDNRTFLAQYGPMTQEEIHKHLFSDETPHSVFDGVVQRHDVSPETIRMMYHKDPAYHDYIKGMRNTPHDILHKLIDENEVFPARIQQPEFVKNNVDKYIDKSKTWGNIHSIFSNNIDLSRNQIDRIKQNIKDNRYRDSHDVATSFCYHKDSTKEDIKELRNHYSSIDFVKDEIDSIARNRKIDLSK